MAAILTNLNNTIIAGFVLAVVLLLILAGWHDAGAGFDLAWWAFLFRWLHVLSGVMWIGILWYFNFVQIPNMPNIEADQRPAITKVIAPAALFWFRWGAMSTIVTGLILAWLNGYIVDAITIGLTSGVAKHSAIGIGMWLGTIMWFNVWFIIWPKQQIALGMVEADDAAKAAAGRTAMLFSRTNTMLSIPMLYAMVAAQNLF
ncbi:urate hydroxylase PuuD [Alphaproteobacteria bacterium]|nr:urate hydroxylase PuuD [Alphaproteobacteria bacterium]